MSSLPVTLLQIAREAGVHVSTASRALRNAPYVDAATRARVREVARRLGYVPDPMLVALSHYRRRRSPPRYQSTLAWINNHPVRRDGLAAAHLHAYHAGAAEFAARMGYRLEEFWLHETGMTPRRAREVLLARGIRGLLFGPQPESGTVLDMNLEPFACVALGYSLAQPRLHTVTNHQHGSALLCLRELCRLGHDRIGMVSATETLRRAQHNFESPYVLLQSLQPESRRIPLLAIEGRDEPRNVAGWRERFRAWFERHRPTVVVSTVSEIAGWLEGLGLRVPDDVGLATLSAIHEPGWSGIDQQERAIGARALELLISLFQSGERGVPSTPLRLLVEGRWIDRGTVRRLGPPATDLLERLD